MAAITVQGRKLFYAGAAVKQAAYDIQHQAWSKEQVVNRDQRLADAKSGALATLRPRHDDVARAAAGAAPAPRRCVLTPPRRRRPTRR